MTQKPIVIYGAGDQGTNELRSLAFARGIPIEFRDIRTTNAEGAYQFLQELHKLGGETVPAIVTQEGTFLPAYEAAHARLMAQSVSPLVRGVA